MPGLDPGDAVDVNGGTGWCTGRCTKVVHMYVPEVVGRWIPKVVQIPPTGDGGLGTGLANTALAWPWLGNPGKALPGTPRGLAPSQSQNGYTRTDQERAVRVSKHERGGPA